LTCFIRCMQACVRLDKPFRCNLSQLQTGGFRSFIAESDQDTLSYLGIQLPKFMTMHASRGSKRDVRFGGFHKGNGGARNPHINRKVN
jgi:hypothetical protein